MEYIVALRVTLIQRTTPINTVVIITSPLLSGLLCPFPKSGPLTDAPTIRQ
jgi:hypothetical protein